MGNSTQTQSITDFLEARIAEDEERDNSGPDASGSCDYLHGVHYGSARVLAECQAKRAIVDLHGSTTDMGWRGGEGNNHLWCTMCGSIDDSPAPWPCDTLRALAAVYADHSDYQKEWAPSS